VQVKNTSVSEGFVFEQDPAPKTEVDKGSKVTIRVSSGDGLPAVPDVVNLPVQEAVNRLTAAGFTTRTIDENSPTAPAGIVTRTDPPAGSKTEKGETRVTVYVSRGAPTTTVAKVPVPSVINLDEDVARARLTNAGFTVSVTTTPGGTPGRVKGQNPSAGTRVDQGSTVTITVGASSTTSSSATTTSTTTGSSTTSSSTPFGI
jgi:beta-lactam-binding protein with PASTA domain